MAFVVVIEVPVRLLPHTLAGELSHVVPPRSLLEEEKHQHQQQHATTLSKARGAHPDHSTASSSPLGLGLRGSRLGPAHRIQLKAAAVYRMLVLFLLVRLAVIHGECTAPQAVVGFAVWCGQSSRKARAKDLVAQ